MVPNWNFQFTKKIECFNCSSLLDGLNNFFLLKCGHPLCRNCIVSKAENGQSDCPNCTIQLAELQEGLLDSLPKYVLVYPMILDPSIHETCMACEQSHSATHFCVDCNQTICEEANHFHLRIPSLSKHVVVPIEEYSRNQKANQHLGYLHSKSCTEHNLSFEFLDLETRSHNKLLCSKCLMGRNNSIFGFGDGPSSFLRDKLDHIRELGSEGTAHLSELREEEASLSSRLKCLEESRAGVLSEIRSVFLSLHEALQTRQSELEREVEELSKSACFALSEEVERSRVWQGQLSLLGKCVEEISSNSNHLSSSLSESLPPHVLSPKALMVDACLLEDALRSSLSSSRASSSLTDVQSRVRVSEIRDQLDFSIDLSDSFYSSSSKSLSSSSSSSFSTPFSSFTHPLNGEDKLGALLRRISSMCSVTSTSSLSCSSPLIFQSDWSQNKVQSVMTFYSQGNGANQLSNPLGMTYSPDSKLFYVCDQSNHRIQVFRNHPQAELEGRVEIEFLPPSGSAGSSTSFSFLSSGLTLNPPYTAPPTPLQNPSGICYHDGQLFIADSCNHYVQVWRAEDGSFLRMIGTGSAGDAVGQFHHPAGCTVYQNHLFVSDNDNHRIQKFSLFDFSVVKVIGSYGSGLRHLSDPRDLSVFNGKLYVTDYDNNRISVFDPESGAALSVIGPSRNLSFPSNLLFSHNLLFVSNSSIISVFDSDHNYLYSFGSESSGEEQFLSPCGMVMVNEKLFVCNCHGQINLFEQQ